MADVDPGRGEASIARAPTASLDRLAVAAVGAAGGLALFGLMLLMVADALLRTFLNAPMFGAQEVTRVLLSVVVACAVPLCFLQGKSITIDAFVERLAPAWQRRIAAAAHLLSAAALAFLAYRCALNGWEASRFGESSMLLSIPSGPFYLALGAGFAASALAALAHAALGRA